MVDASFDSFKDRSGVDLAGVEMVQEVQQQASAVVRQVAEALFNVAPRWPLEAIDYCHMTFVFG